MYFSRIKAAAGKGGREGGRDLATAAGRRGSSKHAGQPSLIDPSLRSLFTFDFLPSFNSHTRKVAAQAHTETDSAQPRRDETRPPCRAVPHGTRSVVVADGRRVDEPGALERRLPHAVHDDVAALSGSRESRTRLKRDRQRCDSASQPIAGSVQTTNKAAFEGIDRSGRTCAAKCSTILGVHSSRVTLRTWLMCTPVLC